MAGGGKGSRKHGRNFRVAGNIGKTSRYRASGGELRQARRKERNVAKRLALKGKRADVIALKEAAKRAARKQRNRGGQCPCWRCKPRSQSAARNVTEQAA